MDILKTIVFLIGWLLVSGIIATFAMRIFAQMVGIRCALKELDPETIFGHPVLRQRVENWARGIGSFVCLVCMAGGVVYWFEIDWLRWGSLAGAGLLVLLFVVGVEMQFRKP